MRINFKTITRSTDREPSILIERILTELDKPGYRIFAQTSTMIISYGVGSVSYYGKALGGTNFVGPGPNGPNANPYELGLDPIDAIDAAAQRHDDAYWKAGANGLGGALFNTGVFSADMQLVNEAFRIMKGYKAGDIDDRTGFPISARTFNIASDVFIFFGSVIMSSYTRAMLNITR